MNTIRGLSLTIALAALVTAPIEARQEGHRHPAPVDTGMCQHMTMAEAAMQSDSTSVARTERRQVRRATGPSRFLSGAMMSVAASRVIDSPDPDRKRTRRATGPSRMPR